MFEGSETRFSATEQEVRLVGSNRMKCLFLEITKLCRAFILQPDMVTDSELNHSEFIFFVLPLRCPINCRPSTISFRLSGYRLFSCSFYCFLVFSLRGFNCLHHSHASFDRILPRFSSNVICWYNEILFMPAVSSMLESVLM